VPGKAIVLRANALDLPLSDESVDLICTSPPFLNLRSYQDAGEHYANQIGTGTLEKMLHDLWEATTEMKRVLKPSGSIFVELGDSYSGSGGAGGDYNTGGLKDGQPKWRPQKTHVPTKSLHLTPHRYAIGCIDQLGLILRAELVWNRPNGLPESVTDRVRRSHSIWFHFTKSPRYFAAVDEIREEHSAATLDRNRYARGRSQNGGGSAESMLGHDYSRRDDLGDMTTNSLGKLPGSVWTIKQEEVDWIGTVGLCRRCKRLRIAGNGSGGETSVVTGRSTSQPQRTDLEESTGSTESPMSSGLDQSPPASPSTISAETRAASIRPTSKSLPGKSTSNEQPRSELTAHRDMSSPQKTSVSTTVHEFARLVSGGVCECDIGPTSVPGSVWSIPTEPLKVPAHLGVDHFAAFPTEFPRRLILGWSPSGICVECGEGRRPVVDREPSEWEQRKAAGEPMRHGLNGAAASGAGNFKPLEATITGYSCACDVGWERAASGPNDNSAARGNTGRPPPPTIPAIVLDPFGGTGTSALVAKTLGRIGISVDLSHDYSRLAVWRTSKHSVKAMSRTNLERQGNLL
jgi:DNA modification methylase